VQSVDRSNGDGGALVGGQRSPELKFDGLGFWGQASKTRRTDVGPKEEGNAPSGLALGYVALTELGNHGNQAPPQLSVVALIEEEVIWGPPRRSILPDFWRIETRARSGWHEAKPNLPLGIVHVEVHQHHRLPCAESRTTPKHGERDRGADERGENVVSPMTRRAVSMLISIITREQPVQSIF